MPILGRVRRGETEGGHDIRQRLAQAWRRLGFEQRLAALAAAGLILTLFLPWYQETLVSARIGIPLSATLSGWSAFSLAEAMVLLAAAGVLTLLFQRAEGHSFELPGGDGGVILGAGIWCCVLVVWRMFDKQEMSVSGPGIATAGTSWGIFVALGMAALLTYAGTRLRSAGPAGD